MRYQRTMNYHMQSSLGIATFARIENAMLSRLDKVSLTDKLLFRDNDTMQAAVVVRQTKNESLTSLIEDMLDLGERKTVSHIEYDPLVPDTLVQTYGSISFAKMEFGDDEKPYVAYIGIAAFE